VSDGSARCIGCGVANPGDLKACLSCGTLLPAARFEPAEATLAPPGDERPARVVGVARLFVALLVLWIGGSVAVAVGARDVTVDLTMTALFAALALGCTIAARAELRPLLRRTGGWRAGAAALIGFGFLVAFGTLYFPAIRWLGFSILPMTPLYLDAGWPRWAPYLLVAVCPALFEELTFRGYVMARLDLILTPRETLLVQAALFSLLHLGVAIFPSHFVIGLVLGALRRRTRSLYPGMAVHLTWNAAVVWAELGGRNFL
jgi:membrane protease YdiL (CAAX protease family)